MQSRINCRMVFQVSPPIAPAYFVGVQDGFGFMPAFELYTLTGPVGFHPAGSTVSRETIEKHGYSVPSGAEVVQMEQPTGRLAKASGF